MQVLASLVPADLIKLMIDPSHMIRHFEEIFQKKFYLDRDMQGTDTLSAMRGLGNSSHLNVMSQIEEQTEKVEIPFGCSSF